MGFDLATGGVVSSTPLSWLGDGYLVGLGQALAMNARNGRVIIAGQLANKSTHVVGQLDRLAGTYKELLENTESLTTTTGPAASAISCSTWSTSLWRDTQISDRANRAPSMIDAWLSSSEMIRAEDPKVVSTARLAA